MLRSLTHSFLVSILPSFRTYEKSAEVFHLYRVDVEGYPGQIINLFVVCGLLWLRWKVGKRTHLFVLLMLIVLSHIPQHPEIVRPFKVWLPLAFFFLVSAVFLLIVPFLRPAGGIGDTPPLPYWLYPIVGISIFFVRLGRLFPVGYV